MPVRSRRFALAGLAAIGDAIPGRPRAMARLALGYHITPRLGLLELGEWFQANPVFDLTGRGPGGVEEVDPSPSLHGEL